MSERGGGTVGTVGILGVRTVECGLDREDGSGQ